MVPGHALLHMVLPSRHASPPVRQEVSPARQKLAPMRPDSSPARRQSPPAGDYLLPARQMTWPACHVGLPAKQQDYSLPARRAQLGFSLTPPRVRAIGSAEAQGGLLPARQHTTGRAAGGVQGGLRPLPPPLASQQSRGVVGAPSEQSRQSGAKGWGLGCAEEGDAAWCRYLARAREKQGMAAEVDVLGTRRVISSQVCFERNSDTQYKLPLLVPPPPSQPQPLSRIVTLLSNPPRPLLPPPLPSCLTLVKRPPLPQSLSRQHLQGPTSIFFPAIQSHYCIVVFMSAYIFVPWK